MDRIWASTDGNADLTRRRSAEDFALPSRGEALLALRPVLEAQTGPILLTGEPGVGKTWLWRRLQAEMPMPWRWAVVDAPPGLEPLGLYRLIGHRLGLPVAECADSTRLVLADFLHEAMADGVRWVLVLDEAHNASASCLEEVRILSNRLGRPDGLAALVLVGQTPLASRLVVRPLKALAARLVAHVHLRAIDVEEARLLLDCLAPGVDWDEQTLERNHRDTVGNPRRLLRAASSPHSALSLFRQRSITPAPRARAVDPAAEQRPPSADAATATLLDQPTPAVGPYKPPLLVGDGIVEVGWDGGIEAELVVPTPPPLAAALEPLEEPALRSRESAWIVSETEADTELEAIEMIDDHYTALQAWNEWAQRGVRSKTPAPPDEAAPAGPEPARETGFVRLPGADGLTAPAADGQPKVWIEAEHGFAPYGPLFSKQRPSRDINESS